MAEYLNLALVHSLSVLLEEGAFGSAAQRLHITAPAMTQQIKRLEASLGYEVVTRGSHPIALTQRGETFMLHARESLEAARRAMGNSLQRKIRVGFIDGYPRRQDEAFLVQFRLLYPDVQLQFVQLTWGDQISGLLSGSVDVSLARPPFDEDGIVQVVVHREPRVVAVPADSDLRLKGSLLLQDIEGLPLLRASGIDSEWTKYWAVDPRPSGTPVVYGSWAATIEEALTAVAMSGNVMITAASVAERYAHPGVKYLVLDDAEYCEVRFCMRAEEQRDYVHALFRSAGQGDHP